MGGTISFGGLVSGLNTNAIIQALLASDQQNITNLQAQQTSIQNQEGGLNDINTKLSSLASATMQLVLSSTFTGKSATAGTTAGGLTTLSATANSQAVNGTYSVTVAQLATDTTVSSQTAIGQPITASATLATAGFGLTPTTGTFTINGKTITIDANTVLSDGTDAPGADTIISKINNSGAGVTASLANDSDGRPNLLQLSSTGAIQLGSGADTSNFLSAANLLAAQSVTASGTTTVTSTANLGVLDPTALLSSAHLATALSASSGSFSINGVSINYDATTDSLSDVINRINSSNAGVTASYDPVSDKLNLKSTTTGSTAIALQDTTGNFLAATGVLNGSQSYGKDALFSIDTVAGGAQQSSTSNTISGLIPGVTLNLQAAAPGQSATVTVATDTTQAVSAMQNFVSAFNAAVDLINGDTSYNANSQQASLFFSDSLVYSIPSELFNRLFTPSGLTGSIESAADLGLSTGAIGSTPGTTNDLQFDANKFTQALQTDPNAVLQILHGTDGTGGIINSLNNYLNSLTSASGVFFQSQQEMDSEIRDIGNQITSAQQLLTQKQSSLQQQFAQMEATLAQLQSQGSQMSSALAGLTGSSAGSSASSSAGSSAASTAATTQPHA